MEKRRPVDILAEILRLPDPMGLLRDFFAAYGPSEAAAMCLLLVTRPVLHSFPANFP